MEYQATILTVEASPTAGAAPDCYGTHPFNYGMCSYLVTQARLSMPIVRNAEAVLEVCVFYAPNDLVMSRIWSIFFSMLNCRSSNFLMESFTLMISSLLLEQSSLCFLFNIVFDEFEV
mmetsp:Transcript_34031/g.65018  ORF Transcript_34031/g.65018 Transcript_34031/m.65018 type:complete len:118 (-) Transcript_34031:497-850(-)